jgi:hypothetical protein
MNHHIGKKSHKNMFLIGREKRKTTRLLFSIPPNELPLAIKQNQKPITNPPFPHPNP